MIKHFLLSVFFVMTFLNNNIFCLALESDIPLLLGKSQGTRPRSDSVLYGRYDSSNIREVQQFLRPKTHELRTKLNAIVGGLELLSGGGKGRLSEEKKKEIFKQMKFAARSMHITLNEDLDFSCKQRETYKLTIIPFDIKIFIKELFNSINVMADLYDIKMELYMDENIPNEVCGDQKLLNIILWNIMHNAIKYTSKATNKKVSLNVKAIRSDNNSYTISFDIIDTGIGFSEEGRKSVFEPYQRTLESQKGGYEGTGLGLSGAKEFVELMGGNIEAHSPGSGKGSRFAFSIPFKISGRAGEISRKMSEPVMFVDEPRKKITKDDLRILIVEDNRPNQMLIKGMLDSLGFGVIKKIVIKENGQEAIEYLSGNSDGYDIIFMDCHMPIMDGFEATKKILDNRLGWLDEDTPPLIIAFTASVSTDDKDKCIASGMDNVLAKPVTFDSLQIILNKYYEFEEEESNDTTCDCAGSDFVDEPALLEDDISVKEYLIIEGLKALLPSGTHARNIYPIVKDNFSSILINYDKNISKGIVLAFDRNGFSFDEQDMQKDIKNRLDKVSEDIGFRIIHDRGINQFLQKKEPFNLKLIITDQFKGPISLVHLVGDNLYIHGVLFSRLDNIHMVISYLLLGKVLELLYGDNIQIDIKEKLLNLFKGKDENNRTCIDQELIKQFEALEEKNTGIFKRNMCGKDIRVSEMLKRAA